MKTKDNVGVAYLSGAMEFAADLGSSWRNWLTQELFPLGYSTLDPVKLEQLAPEEEPLQYKLTKLKKEGKVEELRKLARKHFFKVDMEAIRKSTIVVLYYDESVQKGAGTISEAWEAFRLGKPLYIITTFPLERIPAWLIGESTAIFSKFTDFLSYIKDKETVVNDIRGAEEASREILGLTIIPENIDVIECGG